MSNFSTTVLSGDIVNVLFKDGVYRKGKVTKLVKTGFKIRWENQEKGKRKFDILTGKQTMIVEREKKHKSNGGVYLLALYGKEDGEYRGCKFGKAADLIKRKLQYCRGNEDYKVIDEVWCNTKDRSRFENMLKYTTNSCGWVIDGTKEYVSKRVVVDDVHKMFLSVKKECFV
tara:strand:- start:34 stop:549 length:516 start_codon:yes stop_codon:yes gene_type:complete